MFIKMNREAHDMDKLNLYNRLNQFGEYKYNNRLDTLYVFQLTFIYMLLFIVLTYLQSVSVISKFTKWIITLLFGSLVLLVIVGHVLIFPNLRDKSVWYKMNFGNGTFSPSVYNSIGVPGGTRGNAPTTIAATPMPPPEVPPPSPGTSTTKLALEIGGGVLAVAIIVFTCRKVCRV